MNLKRRKTIIYSVILFMHILISKSKAMDTNNNIFGENIFSAIANIIGLNCCINQINDENEQNLEKNIWENDHEGIIKFLTWYQDFQGVSIGSCYQNSCFNMLLNPIIIKEIDNFLNTNKCESELREKLKMFKNIWNKRSNHEYFKSINPQEKNIFNSLYFGAQMLCWELNPIIKSKEPLLAFRGRLDLKNPNKKNASYKISDFNNRDYFVGGMVLYNGEHSVYAHLLYNNDGTKLERVIIQDPSYYGNIEKDYYVKEMRLEDMKMILSSGKFIDWLLMIREDEFIKNKYWKNSSLIGNLKNKFII